MFALGLSPGCLEPDTPPIVARAESALAEEPAESCSLPPEEPPSPLSVDLRNSVGRDGTVRASLGQDLTFHIDTGESGHLRVQVSFVNQSGQSTWKVEDDLADDALGFDAVVSGDAIDLPKKTATASGLAVVRALFDPKGGGPRRDGLLTLWFHAEEEQWVLYDDGVRSALINAGRLSDPAPPEDGLPPPTLSWVRSGEPVDDAYELEAADDEE